MTKRAVAIVQARMGSGRLPGKSLRPLAGLPLAGHALFRLRQCKQLDDVALATTDRAEDDALADWARAQGFVTVRGSADDVLSRYLDAARATQADIIVRVTGDAPLVDPALVDLLVERLRVGDVEFAAIEGRCSDCGIDPITRDGLERLGREVGTHPVAREHVTGYLHVDPGFLLIAQVRATGDRFVEGARLSVDVPADLAFFEAVYAQLGVRAPEADFLAVLALLRRDPSLLAINAAVRQRAASETPLRLIAHVEAGATAGLGHLQRALAVATAARDRHAMDVVIASDGDDATLRRARDAGFRTMQLAARWDALAPLVDTTKPTALLVDRRTGLDEADLDRAAASGWIVGVMDDAHARRRAARRAWYPPVAGARGLDWRGSTCVVRVGWDWIPLRSGFASSPPHERPQSPPRLLVAAGGSDPQRLLPRLVAAARLAAPTWQVDAIVGPLATAIPAADPGVTLQRDVADPIALLDQASLVVTAYGVFAFEAAARGVASLLVPLDTEQASSAAAFVEAGFARAVPPRADDASLVAAITALVADADWRQQAGARARDAIDGGGAARIADDLAAALHAASSAQVAA
ncbi:cytidylyltransferase domain-containing protein [Roseiterribacter gracilis]|uniref:Acylneuraminate cytidylyltransferase n=1 Tax=Roseiterribacter gracilis TaxID=2812848 RepID=A0A8S8XKX9_9PROT|nr:hypothetical protein TMPK1_37070 [Rhodospirillales bacterium TMPK1]